MVRKFCKSVLKKGQIMGASPVFIGSSIAISTTFLAASCGEYQQTLFESKYNKFFDFNLYEKRIRKSLKSTEPVSKICSDLELFKYDPIFHKKLTQNFHNFVRLINSFSYSPNQEYPEIENEYIGYLVYTVKNYSSFYSNSVERSKIVKHIH
nr:hypothetical protein [Mycoplasmopsis agalactiae]